MIWDARAFNPYNHFARLIFAFVGMFHLIGWVGYLNQADKKASLSRLFLPSLIISNFAASTLGILTALFLLDMSATFGVDRGIMGQINTVSSIVSMMFALSMGILSIRFSHGILILTGMLSAAYRPSDATSRGISTQF